MLDAAALAAPIVQLLTTFGTGVLPGGGPADVLRSSSVAIDSVHSLGRTGIAHLEASWSGATADHAADRAAAAQGSAVAISDRGNSIADVLSLACADVNAGIAELSKILDSFVSIVVAAAPTLATPTGQTMVIGAAIEHLGRALAVVAKVREQLAAHSARMLEFVDPPATPTAPAATMPASQSTSAGADLGTRFVSSAAQSTGAPPVPDMISALNGHSGQGAAGPSAYVANGQGVEVAMPDGSTVVAPNEKAADALRHALSQQGTPYSWGGTTPGVGFDCSGFTQWAYGESGVEIPRTAADQAVGMSVNAADLMPGDLAVWDGHVAMVAGNGMLIEAGDPVELSPLRTSNMGMAFHGFYRPTA
ncbi:C40 family peptidase [Antrihabitans sp. YC2-6]|uniref:C40 family peptidase n=1 Tax=Antrihabitans sp. YC2-6 TaxID=2799498 RepID=UPI0018F753A7|nr:C40 family peptidase [Antrihabitans sp. YC2-6]MBJ8347372.1 C40 family peptidase [Antrihabitans sp. YC2-6]